MTREDFIDHAAITLFAKFYGDFFGEEDQKIEVAKDAIEKAEILWKVMSQYRDKKEIEERINLRRFENEFSGEELERVISESNSTDSESK